MLSLLYGPTLTSIHDHWKNQSLDYTDICWQSNDCAFKYAILVITFLPRSMHLLISGLHSPFAVILEPKKIKSLTVSIVFPSICHEVMGPDAMILVFWWLKNQLFHSPLSPSSKGSLVPLVFLPLEWYHLHIWGCWYFPGSLDSSLWFIHPGISRNVVCIIS